jgi:hypothetical protein
MLPIEIGGSQQSATLAKANAAARRIRLFRLDCDQMKVLTTKQARFAEVVERCGEPHTYTLWQEPKKDRHLQSQVKQGHIMTIARTEKGREYGMVGFFERKSALYLEFPKSLKRFADRRIVGIKWDLVKE